MIKRVSRRFASTRRDHVTLTLCRDQNGYYWETNDGARHRTRHAAADDALEEIIASWSVGETWERFAVGRSRVKVA